VWCGAVRTVQVWGIGVASLLPGRHKRLVEIVLVPAAGDFEWAIAAGVRAGAWAGRFPFTPLLDSSFTSGLPLWFRGK
jgi:hypothetical protein